MILIIYKFVLRSDAAPTHNLFYDNFFATFIFCSDQFAERVFSAGCTGMEFTDPRGYRCADVQRRRTLHGIEVYGEKADPEEYRPTPPIIDVDDEIIDSDLLRDLVGDKDKMDWIVSRLKE